MYLALTRPWQRAEPVAVEPTPSAEPAPPAEPTPSRRKPRKRTHTPGPDSAPAVEEPAPLTAAQERLVWRGDSVALPPAEHDFSSSDERRALTDEEIGAAVQRHSDAVIQCMAQAASGLPLRAKVTLQLLVDGQGRVTRHRVQAPAVLFERGVAPCIGAALRSWRFPSTGAPTLVTAPFELG